MASYQGHITFSSILGAGYGMVGVSCFGSDAWGTAFLGAGLTALGGMMPDLDSDSGRPLRELTTFTAAMVPALMLDRIRESFGDVDQQLVVMAGIYLAVRYGVAACFRKWTVHRGMFHSVPMMLIFGFLVFLLHPEPSLERRIYVAGGMVVGFFSHLLLDEIYSVDLMGAKLKKSAGTGLKFSSKSSAATTATYLALFALAYVVFLDSGVGQ